MPLLTLPETSTGSTTTLLRKPDVLRVRIADNETVRIVSLTEGKTTIGSSPQCTVVLPTADSRPLQCVVTIDENRAEATRWGAGVQLNLRDFSKSPVSVGDKLTIGSCELEFAAAEDVKETVERATLPEAEVAEPSDLKTATVAVCDEADLSPGEKPSKAKSPAVESLAITTVECAPLESREASPSAPTVDAAELPRQTNPWPLVSAPSTALATIPQKSALPLQPTQLASASQPTIVIEPTPSVSKSQPAAVVTEIALPPAEETTDPTLAASSHAFADELILQLWQAGDRSNRRAKSLIAATRDARFRTNAMAADLAAIEVELDLARAAYDSHAADHQELHLELIKQDRIAAERLAPLTAEVESLRSQLQEAQIELSEQAARCDELNATLETQASTLAASAAAKTTEDHRTAEFEQSLAVQIEQATLLAHELGAVRTELDGVKSELEQQAARRQELESQLTAVQQEQDSNQQFAEEAAAKDATIAQLREEVAGLQGERADFTFKLSAAESELTRLAEQCHSANDRVVELERALASVEPSVPETEASAAIENSESSTSDAANDSTDEPATAAALDDTAWNATAESTPEHTDELADLSHEATLEAWTPTEEPQAAAPEQDAAWPATEPTANVAQAVETPVSVAPPASVQTVPVASELAPTSFIDKYRHLLDDDGSLPTPSATTAPPVIDDEFLSPAKAADRTVPADDSDEALDAYMASMMQRMRSHSSAAMPAPELAPPTSPVAAAPSDPAPLDYDPSVPFEIESMKQGRKAPVSTDLAALREIANTSARSAIETHRKKRKVESAVGKIVIAVISFATGGYLLLSAPTLQDWQFGAGAVVSLVGFGAAALAMRHPDRVRSAHVDLPSGAFAAGESAHGDA